MNSMVTLPIAAAVPVASSSASVGAAPWEDGNIDYVAMLARAEHVIETFRTRFISDDFTLDNDGAERVLRYFRRASEGYPDDDTEWGAVIDFFSVHGKSLDWVLCGTVDGMICRTAALTVYERSHRQDADHDSRLLELEEQIFELNERAHEHDEGVGRLLSVWRSELERLEEARWDGGPYLNAKERLAAVRDMPEHREHVRLIELTEPLAIERDELIRRMWTIPACTPEGRRAKLLVLLGCVMGGGWTVVDEDANWEVELARKLMIEFVGGDSAEQLRDQFA